MFKKLTILSIFTLLTLGPLSSPTFSAPVSAQAEPCTAPGVPVGCTPTVGLTDAFRVGVDMVTGGVFSPGWIKWLVIHVLDAAMALLSKIISWLLRLVGGIFDLVLTYTIVDMTKHIS